MKRVALYCRVSTDEQTVDNQRLALEEVVQAHPDWQMVATYTDEGISGSKGRNRRPGFDRLLKDAIRSKFDMVAAVSVDRSRPLATGSRRLPRRNPGCRG